MPPHHVIRRRRWLILTLYSLVGVLNFGMWLTFATLPMETTSAFEDVQPWMASLLSVVVGFGYLLGAVPAGRVLTATTGLRSAMLWASWINLSGSLLRCLGGVLRSFWAVFSGQLLVGIAQPFFMAAPAQLSKEWFPSREHGLATSIGILSQVLGQALIFLIGPAVASLPVLLASQLVASALLLCAIWWLFLSSHSPPRELPPTAPDSSTREAPNEGLLVARALPCWHRLPCSHRLLHSRSFGVLAFTSAVLIGTFWTLSTELEHLLLPLGYTEQEIGYIGFTFIGSGMLGLLCAGPALDRTHAYQSLTNACAVGASLSGLALVAVAAPSNFGPLMLVCALLGFWLTAIQAVALETAAEITFPLAESASSGLIFGAAVGVYCTLPFVIDALLDRVGVVAILWAHFAVLAASSVVLAICFRPTYVRTRMEATHEIEPAPITPA